MAQGLEYSKGKDKRKTVESPKEAEGMKDYIHEQPLGLKRTAIR